MKSVLILLVHAVHSTHMMISTLTSAEKGFVHFGEKWNHLSSRATNSAAWCWVATTRPIYFWNIFEFLFLFDVTIFSPYFQSLWEGKGLESISVETLIEKVWPTSYMYLVLHLARKVYNMQNQNFSLVLVSVLRTSINVLSKSKSKNYVTWIANLTKLFQSV